MAQARELRAKRLRGAKSSPVGSPSKAKARGSRNGSTAAALHGFDPYAPSDSMTKEERLLARKIRNRQSAALSRQRKTDLIEELEERVRQLSQENSVLKARLRAAEGVPTTPMSAVSAAAGLVAELHAASHFDEGESSSSSDPNHKYNPNGDSYSSSDEEMGLPVRKRTRSDTHRHNLRPHVHPASRFTRGTPASAAAVSKTNLMMDQRFNQPLPAE